VSGLLPGGLDKARGLLRVW